MRNHLALLAAFAILGYFELGAQSKLNIDSLETVYNMLGQDTLKVKTASNIVNYYMYRDTEKARKFAFEELKLSEKLKYTTGVSLSYYQLGVVYNTMTLLDSAEFYYSLSLKLAKQMENSIHISQAHRGLAILEFNQGNLNAADSINNLDLEYTKRYNDSTGMALAYDFKGTINQNKGFYSIALSNVFKGLELFRKIGDSIRIADSYNHLATLEHNLGNHRNSIEYNLKALHIYEKHNDIYYQAQAHNDIGVMYMSLKEEEKARDHYGRSLEKSKEVNAKALEAASLTNLGATYLQLNEPDTAIPYLIEAIDISRNINARRRIAIASNKLAEAYLKMNNPKQARSILAEVRSYAEESENVSILKNTLRLESAANEKLGNFQTALAIFQKHKELSDSLINKEKIKQIEELRILFETEKKEAEIALQKQVINTLNEKAKVDKLSKRLFAGGMTSALALSGLLIFGFRQRMKKNRIAREKQEAIYKQQIAYKKKELTSQTLHLVQKNTFIQELLANLENIKSSPERFKVEFRRIIMLLKRENASDKDWEVFKTYFAEVHNDFDQKLKTIFADISEKEIRLAAFLRMNLTTKEIAVSLNVLPESVLKSKYRLKKRLGIGRETDLQDFLSSL